MRIANPETERKIKAEALRLLMAKEPEEIGMREIAEKCGVSATTIYYYYDDKSDVFEAVKLQCLAEMTLYIEKRVARGKTSANDLREGLSAFRDWCFANSRVALLVMGRFKANVSAGGELLDKYYEGNALAERLLKNASEEGLIDVTDFRLSASLCIAALWGSVEAVLLNRTFPEYWKRGKNFTDGMIDLCLAGMGYKGEGKK